MTDQTPAPPPPPTSAGAQGPPATNRRGRKTIVGGAAAALVVAAAGGGYAVFNKLDGGGTQPHDVMPASTQFYARLDVDPSASQKIKLLKLIRKSPAAAKSIGIDSPDQDIRKLVFDELVSKECPDVDYQDDVEPWLGERLGVGGELKDEKFVIAVQTKDETKARAGIKKLFACGDEGYGIGFLDGYAILSEKQSVVDDSIKATEKGTLGEKKEFVDDFDALGDQGVASVWADLGEIAKDPGAKKALGSDVDAFAKSGTAASTLRVDGNAVELAALSGGTPVGATKPVDLGKLPSDTVAALSVVGVGDEVGEGFDALVEAFDSGFAEAFGGAALSPGDDFSSDRSTDPYSAQDFIDEIETTTGFRLPEDLETLFGDSLTLAVGGANLENLPDMQGPDDLEDLDVALALTTDKVKGLDLVQRIAQLAQDAGIPLFASPTDDGAVLATNQGAAEAVVKPDGTLGDEKAFTDVIPTGDSTYGGLFVNIAAVISKLEAAGPPDDVAADLEEAKVLSALGLSVTRDDDRSMVSVRLAFKD